MIKLSEYLQDMVYVLLKMFAIFLSEQVTLKGQLEAQARSLTEKLVAEEECADNAEKELLLD